MIKKISKALYFLRKRIVYSLNRFLLISEFVEDSQRLTALDFAVDIVSGDQIEGDYFEFGVYKGSSFARVYNRLRNNDNRNVFLKRRFFAFDSFEGLPDSNEEHLPEQYAKGAYSSGLKTFYSNIKRRRVDLGKVVAVKGFYNESLTEDLRAKHSMGKLALAYFDADLYESTIDALNFVTPHVQKGTILVFDDWFRHRSSKTEGVQRACNEWLEANPNIELNIVHMHRRVTFVIDIKS